jgi:hypothetical protein
MDAHLESLLTALRAVLYIVVVLLVHFDRKPSEIIERENKTDVLGLAMVSRSVFVGSDYQSS